MFNTYIFTVVCLVIKLVGIGYQLRGELKYNSNTKTYEDADELSVNKLTVASTVIDAVVVVIGMIRHLLQDVIKDTLLQERTGRDGACCASTGMAIAECAGASI
eukprot:tig00000760_g3944.t1